MYAHFCIFVASKRSRISGLARTLCFLLRSLAWIYAVDLAILLIRQIDQACRDAKTPLPEMDLKVAELTLSGTAKYLTRKRSSAEAGDWKAARLL
jgi:hypothetical protein